MWKCSLSEFEHVHIFTRSNEDQYDFDENLSSDDNISSRRVSEVFFSYMKRKAPQNSVYFDSESEDETWNIN